MMPDGDLYFLPWLRRGLTRHVTTLDQPGKVLPAAEVRASVKLKAGGQREISQTFKLRHPGHVAGLEPRQILRTEPPANGRELSPNFFPFVELASPDLPWLFTPASAGANDRLRPWLVLVTVEDQDGVSVAQRRPDELPILRIAPPAQPWRELPDLEESWAWAHVQTALPFTAADLGQLLERRPEAFVARLICPRRLEPYRRYQACLVPAFRQVQGRFLETWKLTEDLKDIELAVYFSWSFETGPAGDFEGLVRRLEPRPAGPGVGSRPMRIESVSGQPGGRMSFRGALWAPQAPAGGDPTTGDETADTVETRRRAVDDPADDPVVSAPVYGTFHAGQPAAGSPGAPLWLRQLNRQTRLRAAAGLGTEVVRRHQEALMAEAWRQAGELRSARRLAARSRLAGEVGARLQQRFARLDDDTLTQVAAAHTSMARLGSSLLPRGPASLAFRRLVRPGSAADRASRRLSGSGAPAAEAPAIPPDALEVPYRQARRALWDARPPAAPPLFRLPGASLPVPPPGAAPLRLPAERLRQLADGVRGSVDARAAAAAAFARRLRLRDADRVTGDFELEPRFELPLYRLLVELSPELLLAGAGQLADESVALLRVDRPFIAAFLVGANHEMSREAEWRELPAPLAHTWFRHFWAAGEADVEPIADWPNRPLHRMVSSKTAAVLIVKGELLRRFAHVTIYAVPASWKGGRRVPGAPETAERPTFAGRLSGGVAFFGFALETAELRGSRRPRDGKPGWFLVLEEAPTDTRFGLDEALPEHAGTKPETWKDLSWGHLVEKTEDLEDLTHVSLDVPHLKVQLGGAGETGARWGKNAAHMALITRQPPFRLKIHADALLPEDP